MFQETISAIYKETLYKNRPSIFICAPEERSDPKQSSLICRGLDAPDVWNQNFPAFNCIRCLLIKNVLHKQNANGSSFYVTVCPKFGEVHKSTFSFDTLIKKTKKTNRNGLIWRLGLSASSAASENTTDEAITSCKYSPVSLFIYCTALPSNIELTSFAFFFARCKCIKCSMTCPGNLHRSKLKERNWSSFLGLSFSLCVTLRFQSSAEFSQRSWLSSDLRWSNQEV